LPLGKGLVFTRWHKFLSITISFVIVLILLDLLFPPPLQKAEDLSPIVLDRNDVWVHAFTNDEGMWRFSAHLEDLDPDFVKRLIVIEDKRFYYHWGVDVFAILRATGSLIKNGRIVSGASTITMQTARLLEPRSRHIGSKFLEMIRAIQIERRLNKQEILELYLTLTPYGGNIQGVRAASLIWFDREPKYLTPAQQALLIALPQAPEARRPDRRPHIAQTARTEILTRLERKNALSSAMMQEAIISPIPLKRTPLQRDGWHLSLEIANQRKDQLRRGDHKDERIKTSLDLSLQQMTQNSIRQYLKSKQAEDIDKTTSAAMIIDNHSREVLALVGSGGLDQAGGWNDLSRAIRSPGSTLKPFIYGLAIEDGLVNAESRIEDMPRSFDGYSPENFDRNFRGEVSIKEALQHSLNVPAVSTLEKVGASRLAAVFQLAGAQISSSKNAKEGPGLALALGGVGISMRDLAILYTGLAADGRVKPLNLTPIDHKTNKPQSYRLFSNLTAKYIQDILYGAPSLRGRVPHNLTQNTPKIAFKTGTSYGYRDAWAAGFNERYTIIVWIGRADGAPRPGHTGRNTAAPLLANLFDSVQQFQSDDLDIDDDNNEKDNIDLYANLKQLTPLGEKFTQVRPPEIIFPRDGVELFVDTKSDRGLVLSARGGNGRHQWYVDGNPIISDSLGDQFIWKPKKSGFYRLAVIDENGYKTESIVRVRISI